MKPTPKHLTLFLITLLSFCCSLSLKAQSGSGSPFMITIAGAGTGTALNDGLPCSFAYLQNPNDVYIDSRNNMLIADRVNNRVRKINTLGIISTIAGTSASSSFGDGGPATAAGVLAPNGVCMDAAGNVYITADNKIRKVDIYGNMSRIAGGSSPAYSGDGGAATSASLNTPVGICADSRGNIYVCDANNHRVRKIDTAGIIRTIAGTGSASSSGDGGPATAATLNYPNYLKFDSVGNLLITEGAGRRVRRIDTAGNISTIVGNGSTSFGGDGGAATAAGIIPTGIAFGTNGNLYIADGYHRVRMVNTSGIISTIAGTGTRGFNTDSALATSVNLNNPAGIAMDPYGNLIVADNGNSRIRKILYNLTTCTGTPNAGTTILTPSSGYEGTTFTAVLSGRTIASGLAFQWQKSAPVDSAFTNIPGATDSTYTFTGISSNVYLRCIVSCVGRMDTSSTDTALLARPSAIISTIVGTGISGFSGDGGAATAADLNVPVGITTDAAGNIYFCDRANYRIRKVSTTGVISTIAGIGFSGTEGDNGPATAALVAPNYICLDRLGNIYFSDGIFRKIRKINTAGIISTVAGNGVSGYSGDNGPATAAQLSYPEGLCFDTSGTNLYIADQNHNVRKINLATGIITTVAGTGTSGFSGDGAAATAAQLNTPYSVAVDRRGNLFIADNLNMRIRKVDAGGTISTFAGTGVAAISGDGGPALTAYLGNFSGMVVDANGDIYLVTLNSKVCRIDTNGIFTIVGGIGTAGYSGDGGAATAAQLQNPAGLSVDATGNIYVADSYNDVIRLIGTRSYLTSCTGTPTAGTALVSPTRGYESTTFSTSLSGRTISTGLAFQWQKSAPTNGAFTNIAGATDSSYTFTGVTSNTYLRCIVSCAGNMDTSGVDSVLYTPPSPIITTIAGTGLGGYSGDGGPATSATLTNPWGVACDWFGNVFITDQSNYAIRKIDPSGRMSTFAGTGTYGFSGDGSAATAAMVGAFIRGIITDRAGNVYFTDAYNYRIRKVNTSGIISTVAGTGTNGFSGDGGAATLANLSMAGGLAVDASGNLYIADVDNHRVRKVNTSGIISTIAGNGTAAYSGDGGAATAASLNTPYGVGVDASGNVYIADATNNRIRKVNTSGIISTIAGTGATAFSGDGGPATAANVYYPVSVVVDRSGNIIIGESGNNRVRQINTSNIITTLGGNGGTGYRGDGGPATAADIYSPSIVALDSAGNVYLRDYTRHVIRLIGTRTLSSACSGTPTAGTVVSSPASGGYITAFTLSLSGASTATGLTYQWQRSNTSVSGPYTNIAGATNSTYAFIGVSANTYFQCIVTCSGASATSAPVTIAFTNPSPYIFTVAGTGTASFSGDGGRAAAATLNNSDDVFYDKVGSAYYITDAGNHRIRKVNAFGIISTVVGTGTAGSTGDGGPATAATIDHPVCMTMDSVGNFYFTDWAQHVIRKVTPAGVISTIAGTAGTSGFSADGTMASAARFVNPFGLGIDRSGNIIFADGGNQRIRKINSSGALVTLAGTGTGGFSGDNGPASAAQTYNANYIYVDRSNNIFIADNGNHRYRKINAAGIITTIAGTGTGGFSGDGGQATAAQVSYPAGITSDALGNVYLVENGGHRLRVVDTSGIIRTYAGTGTSGYSGDGGPATAAQLSGPRGITSDAYNRIYLIGNNNRVRIIGFVGCAGTPTAGSATSNVTTACTTTSINLGLTGTSIDSGISFQWQKSTDSITYSDISGATSATYTTTQSVTTWYRCVLTCAISGFNAASTQVRVNYSTTCPCLSGTPNAGTTIVSPSRGYESTTFSTSLRGRTIATGLTYQWQRSAPVDGAFTNISGATDSTYTFTGISANVYLRCIVGCGVATDTSATDTALLARPSALISTVAGTGTGGYTSDGIAATASGLYSPVGVAIDAAGNIYVGDAGNYRIRKVSAAGVISTIAGVGSSGTEGDNGPATAAYTNTSGLCLDRSGNIYFADQHFQKVRKINTSGIISTVAGTGTAGYSGDNGPATAAQLNLPYALCIDTAGVNLYVSETNNQTIRKINLSTGIINTVAGTGTYGFSGDGAAATAARLGSPIGVAIDRRGNLYVAEYGNSRIRKINRAGIISSYVGIATGVPLGEGGPSTAATLSRPLGVAVDASDNLFFVTETYALVMRIDTFGIITTVGGSNSSGYTGDGGAATAGRMNSPTGLSVDATGNIYVADYANHVIRLIGTRAVASCSGTPTAGSIIATDTIGCSAYSSTLYLGGASSDPGITYQWQSSSDNISWNDVSGATATVYVTSVTATTFYKAVVTCSSGGIAASASVRLNEGLPSVDGITGPDSVCEGSRVSLASLTPGGIWTSTFPSVASVNRTTGEVTGVAAGTVDITYGVTNACGTTNVIKNMLVKPSFFLLTSTGLTGICVGVSSAYSNALAGGTWSVSNPSVASINATTGAIYARAAGTTDIYYTFSNFCGTGTDTFSYLTVNPSPDAGIVSGRSTMCPSDTTTLRSTVSGGTWSTTASSVATINASTGLVFSLTNGTAPITYIVANSCGIDTSFWTITVSGSVTAGTISGATTVCTGANTTLTSTVSGGSWSVNNLAIASIGSTSGVLHGTTAGVVTVTYTVTNSCGTAIATYSVTVNTTAAAGTISGTTILCPGDTSRLSSTVGGGTWTSSATGIAAINSATGLVTAVAAGSANITYTVAGSCGAGTATTTVTVQPATTAGTLSGPTTVCAGASITLTPTVTGGAWSSANNAIATVSGGSVTGVAAGSTTISYTVTGACGTATTTYAITVAPSVSSGAGTITGTAFICPATTTTLTDTVTGGTWSSTNTTVATISTTGVVTGIRTGTTTISYLISSSCGAVAATRLLVVNPLPFADTIAGATILCPGTTTTLTSAVAGGSWTSGSPAIASVNSTGTVRGNTTGSAIITYSVTNSCGTATATKTVTVTSTATAGTISGTRVLCVGTNSTLTSTAAGGTWRSTNTAVATINTTGQVTAITTGTSIISYTVTNSCGTATATDTVTVNPLPDAGTISGPSGGCSGVAAAFTATATGGVWSSANPTVATVSTTGSVTGGTAGTTNILYTITNSCGTDTATQAFTTTVRPSVRAIVGSTAICTGASATYTNAATGGTWSSTNTAVVTISSTGAALALANGTSTISYSLSNACGNSDTALTVTVSTSPSAGSISGATSVCQGAATTLTNGVTGGTWTSNNSTIATISSTGVVTGVSAGTTIITYAVTSSCGTSLATFSFTVNPLPSAGVITGTAVVCPGTTTTLTDTVTGGTWSSSNTAIATVSSAGVVRGIALGTVIISYTTTNACGTRSATRTVNVTTGPSAGTITGTTTLCNSGTTTLSDTATGGTWSSSNTAVATVNAAGVVSGVSIGTAVITYTITNSCGSATATTTVSVTAGRSAGIITGSATVCAGSTTSYTDTATGGTWSSSNTAIATVSTTGAVTAIATGTVTLSYGVTGSCGTNYATRTITIDAAASAGAITGANTLCIGFPSFYSDTVIGGTWSVTPSTVATITTAGILTGLSAGTATVSYTVTNSCGAVSATQNVTITGSASAGAITGANTLCTGSTITLTDSVAGGTWSSSAAGIATVSTTGVVTGVAAGSATIFYTVVTACGTATASHSVTVGASAFAGTLSGTSSICTGSSTGLTASGSAGGTWSSSAPTIATVSSTGVVTGVAAGAAIISYSVTGSCGVTVASLPVTVVNSVSAGTISGVAAICVGSATTLIDTTTGGTWSSANTAIATVSNTGTVTGLSAGTTTISYAISSSCGSVAATYSFRVDAPVTVAPIGGATAVCGGSSTTLTDSVAGGTWTTSNPSVASVSALGVVTGGSAGSATITYMVTSTCGSSSATATISVSSTPVAGTLSGRDTLCVGSTGLYSSTVAGGTWSSSNVAIATVSATGLVTGTGIGSATTTYTVTNSCGTATATKTITVNAAGTAGVVSGPASVCQGASVVFTNTLSGGTWSSSNNTVATIGSTGVAGGVAGGTSIISYIMNTSCGTVVDTALLTVIPTPRVPAISGIAFICTGTSGTFTDSTAGGTWTSSNTAIATVSASGVVTGIASGAVTISYTVSNACGTATGTFATTVGSGISAVTLTGATTVCTGATGTLTPSVSGGTFTSSNASVATVTSTGVVTGISAGTATISYAITGSCGSAATATTITVTAAPTAGTVTGTIALCSGASATFSSTVSGGVWGSSASSIATVSASGVVTGVTAGTAIISYTTTNACGSATDTILVTIGAGSATPTITGGGQYCSGSAHSLTASVTGGSWSSSNASVATISASGAVTALSAGVAIISYSVTGTCGTNTDTALVTVVTAPSAGAISGATTLCTGATISLTASVAGGSWSSSNAGIASVSPTTGSVTGVAAGTATITYTVTNACGTATATTSVTVGAGSASAGTISGASAVCVGSVVSYTASVSGGTWTSSNAAIATVSATGQVTGLAAGSVTITYAISSSCGTATTTANITVNAVPVVGAISGATMACTGTTVTLTNATTGGSWSSSNTAVATVSSTGVVSALSVGTATISYVVTNSSGCTAVAVYTLSVGNMAPTGTISPTGSRTLCGGSPVAIIVTSSSATAYQWYRNGAAISGATNATYSAAVAGGYSVIISSACGRDTLAGPSVVNAPNPVISFLGSNTLGTGSFASYQWYRNGAAIPGATGSTYVYSLPGVYTVRVTDANGCAVTSASYTVPSGSTQVNDIDLNAIRIYPNPTESKVYIESPVKVRAIVMNAVGQVLFDGNDVTEIDLAAYASGVYMVKLINAENQIVKTAKIVKAE